MLTNHLQGNFVNYESASFIEKERQEAYIHLAKTTLSGVEFEKHLEKAEGGRNLSTSSSLKSHIIHNFSEYL